jgi:hypothetical protein
MVDMNFPSEKTSLRDYTADENAAIPALKRR